MSDGDLFGLKDVTPGRLGAQLGTVGPGINPQLKTPAGRYDQNVGMTEYLANEAMKLPGGILGLAPDVASWAASKALGVSSDFGSATRGIQQAMGANLEMRPPGPGTEKLGILQSNLLYSVPFAGQAARAGGALKAIPEMAAGFGGGAGQIIGEEMASPGSPVAGTVGNFIGSIMGFRAGNVVEKLVPVANAFAHMMTNRAAAEAAALKARGILEGTPEYQAALGRAMDQAKRDTVGSLRKAYAEEDVNALEKMFNEYSQIQQRFPGIRNSVGEITGNEAAGALQKRLESQNIPALEERGARIRGNQQALLGARSTLVPQSTGGPKSVLRGARNALDEKLDSLGQQESSYAGDLMVATDKMEAAARPTAQVGATIKKASQEGYTLSKANVDRLYKDFRTSLIDEAATDVSPVLSRLESLRDTFVFDKQPEVLGHISKTAGEAQQMTVAQLDDLTSAANRDIQRLQSMQNPDRKAIGQLQAIKKEAEGVIENSLAKSGNTEALAKYREAKTEFGTKHAPKYLTGVNLELRLRDAVNEERVKPEDVVRAYYQPVGTTEAKRFNQQFAKNGPAKETLARGVFDLYKKEVIDKGGGVITDDLHNKFMRRYAAPNAEYPWIASRLEKNKVAGEIQARMAEKRQLMGEIAKSKLAEAVGTRDPEAFIDFALSNKRELFNTLMLLNPEQKRNFAIAVINRGWDEAGKGSTAVTKFLNNDDNLRLLYREAFGRIKGDRQMDNLQKLARGLQITEAAPKTAPMHAISEDTFQAATGTRPLQIFAAIRAMGRRMGSADYFLVAFGGMFAKSRIEKEANALLKQQLFEPDMLMQTLRAAQSGGISGGYAATERGKQLLSKTWDLTKAAVGKDAPTAAVKRLPIAITSSSED